MNTFYSILGMAGGRNLMATDGAILFAEMPTGNDFRKLLSTICEQSEEWGILVLGIDGFKRINNLYSYSFGDRVLQQIAAELAQSISQNMSLYRLDGDSFAILCKGICEEELTGLYHQIRTCVHEHLEIDGASLSLGVSAGICFYPQDGVDEDTLYRNARIALAAAKEQGGNRYALCSYQMLARAQHSMRLRETLHQAVANGCEGFTMHYQPLILAQTGELYGCEALLRWQHPTFPEGISPVQFIPVLEDSGLIIEIGHWVIRQSFSQCAEWAQIKPDFQMSVNVSSLQFEDPAFKLFVMSALQEYGLNPSLITFELTESDKITNMELVANAFDFFRGQGLKIAYDDFGTGYASLGIFRQLSADELKIDRTFLERITYDITDQKIISQLINLCDSMNMYVCVEGVENAEMEHAVRQMKPLLLQGYHYSRPIPADLFCQRFLRRQPSAQNPTKPVSGMPLLHSELRAVQPLSMEEAAENAFAAILQVSLDDSLTLLSCNEGYRRLIGYTTSDIEEKFQNRALAFVHPDDKQFVATEIQRQLGMGDRLIAEFRMVRADGSIIWVIGSAGLVKSRQGIPSLVVVLLDQDELKRKTIQREQDMREKLQTDPLTGLLNRSAMEERLTAAIPALCAEKNHALYLADINEFKALNEQAGHLFGDEVLSQLAHRQTLLFGEQALLARVGGDKFMGFVPLPGGRVNRLWLEEQLSHITDEPIRYQEKSLRVQLHIGVSCFPQDGPSYHALYQHAERALSRSKELGSLLG